MSILQEFKTFAMRGSVVDLAIGVIIGASFGKIVSSLVNDVLMPPIGYLLGGMDFSSLSLTLKQATTTAPAVAIKYGAFLNTVIDFMIVAWVIFLVVKGMNHLTKMRGTDAVEPTTRDCPECLMTIPVHAKRCGHCGTEIKG